MASSLSTTNYDDSGDGCNGNSGSQRLPHYSNMHQFKDSHGPAASPLRQTHQAPNDTTQYHRTSEDRQADLVAPGIKAVKEKTMLPYCTQACLLGLEQIAIHPENNCALLYNEGQYGAIGRLFKLSINGYGYTFAAKAVESHNVRRLKRETRIYRHLHQQQGIMIPAYLGLVKLLWPYPFMAKFTTLSHLMLMSYIGKALHYGSSLEGGVSNWAVVWNKKL
ncbi:hypothetical protein Cpir12675_002762 [Ceratocystis pirilliformis]|uniref:Uncharacterized protein n=1 Tax=Ceratocystis pirilliformis TaxID=259994 RepID=A0ABR3Z9G7_9PEZI